ncbi:MAG: PAS domain S-box protein, partial [Desulfurivibrionaceae bacterium]
MKAKTPAGKTLASEIARFHELASQSLEWVWEIDTKGDFTYCSPSCKALYGYEPSELLGRNAIETLIPPEDRDAQREMFEEIRRSKKPCNGLRRRVIRKDGAVIPVETHCLPVLAGNTVVGFCG